MRSPTIARSISLFLDVDVPLLDFESHPDAVSFGQPPVKLAPGWTVMRGRRVLEVKPRHATKALGVDTPMAEAPFLGGIPIDFGEDVTDLDRFEAIRRHERTSVAVGQWIAGRGDLQLDAPDQSLALLRDALKAGADSRRIGEVMRACTHA